MNMISVTGRSPVIAAPTAAPRKPVSDIGVSRTRSGPNVASRPSDVLKGPSATATSSPNTTTRGSSLHLVGDGSADRLIHAHPHRQCLKFLSAQRRRRL